MTDHALLVLACGLMTAVALLQLSNLLTKWFTRREVVDKLIAVEKQFIAVEKQIENHYVEERLTLRAILALSETARDNRLEATQAKVDTASVVAEVVTEKTTEIKREMQTLPERTAERVIERARDGGDSFHK